MLHIYIYIYIYDNSSLRVKWPTVGGADGKDFQHNSLSKSVEKFSNYLSTHKNVNFNYLEKCETHSRNVNWAKYVGLKHLFTDILEHFTVIALSELCCKRAPVYASVFM